MKNKKYENEPKKLRQTYRPKATRPLQHVVAINIKACHAHQKANKYVCMCVCVFVGRDRAVERSRSGTLIPSIHMLKLGQGSP